MQMLGTTRLLRNTRCCGLPPSTVGPGYVTLQGVQEGSNFQEKNINNTWILNHGPLWKKAALYATGLTF